jgi:hypothetical protein
MIVDSGSGESAPSMAEASFPDAADEEASRGQLAGLRKGISRRVFLRRGSMVAGAAAAFATVPGLSALLTSGEADGPELGGAAEGGEAAVGASEPVVAHVVNAASGEINLYQGTQMVTARSPALAQALARLAASK